MKWTEEQTIKFVTEYVKHECLYNVNCHGFGVRYARNAALVKLSACMGLRDFGPKDAHHKLRSLKSTYSQELKKIKESASTSHVYTPNVKWFKIFHNAMMAVNSGECRDTSHVEDYPHDAHETEKDLEYENDRLTEEPSTWDTKIYYRSPHIKTNPRKRKMTDYSSMTEGQNTVNDGNKEENSENEFDIFGRSVAAQLKNMPLDRAIEAQMFIQNYLSDMRLKALQSIAYKRGRCGSPQSNDEIV